MGSASSVVIITLVIIVVIIVVTTLIVVYSKPSGCGSDADCLSTQVCQNRLCLMRAGQVCVMDSECAQGLVCRNNICTTNTAPSNTVNLNGVTTPPTPPVITNVNIMPPMVNTGVSGPAPGTTNTVIGPRPRMAPQEWTECEDDEVNSCGKYEDAPFAVISGASSDEGTDKVVVEELTRMHGSLVIDACTYSNYNIYLLRDGMIIVEEIGDCNDGNSRVVSSNVMAERIVAYDGTIFVVHAGVLYRLQLNSFSTTVWQWERDSLFPVNIIDISVTDDCEWLWIQTKTEGYLFHRRTLTERNTYSSMERRIYGADRYHYLELDRELCQGKMYPERTPLTNVCYGRATAEGGWVTVGLDQQRKYERIVMLNWRPYFLRRF